MAQGEGGPEQEDNGEVEAHRLGPHKVVVLLDSNTLILMASGRIAPSMILEAINSSFTPATTSTVVAELRELAEIHKTRLLGRRAQTALRLLQQMGVEVIETESRDADDSLEEAAEKLKIEGAKVYVATSDRSLRRRLRRRGVPTIYYRSSEARLEADWWDDL
ncbi:hypothetical protein apy_07250 [Aeropyrum pernix]|uniref:PIN domain-containing protein n=1 Tax=Aeropyrum pernix TaxID=56636 RepID=A0A401H9D6_AERPX|nr:hypothetical protein apy_07250 [Aeropyrum pernix]